MSKEIQGKVKKSDVVKELPKQEEVVVTEMPEQKQVERISEEDKNTLESLRVKKEFAQMTAEKATAQAEAAEMTYRYNAIQLFIKYSLTASDTIDPVTGEITRK
jgi:3-hydroxyisobutyrate dehydrogenase-like beta-hydroxyacid dehydrogenase